jgi:pyruvate dehydrogenase E2 component (dihydrolipoamide acetyltransferase)
MVTKVVMPKLSLTMKEGTVGKWYKKEGDAVEKNEPIVEVVSEKATYDLEAPAAGILRKILVQEGVDVPVNQILAVITGPDEQFSEAEMFGKTSPEQGQAEARILASPAAKRLAKEYDIDLSQVKGSGPEGRIAEEDVEKLVQASREVVREIKQTILLTGFRKTTAERLSMSFKTAPHSTIVMEIDVSKAKAEHEKLEVSYTAILVEAVAWALTAHPAINSSLDGNEIKTYSKVNIGIAVNTENGLVVPVIHDADQKPVRQIDYAIKELTSKAKAGKLTREELSGGTFTITNLGMYGVDFFIPIINPPEAAILAVGKINEKPIVVGGIVEIRPMMTLSLAYDHRIVDGAPAAEFLRSVKNRIERIGLGG